jgi:SAM-dependent methyltransferase
MKILKSYQKFFESIGSPLLNLSDNVDAHLISVIQKEIQSGDNILEISCGNGADSLKLKDLGYEVTCTEYNSDYVENAENLGLNCIQHDTRKKFPFSNGHFDLIYSRLGLHYFSEEELLGIFSELKRIGKLILFTVKLTDDIKTGKVILSEDKWKEIVSKFFNIKYFEIKEGELYGSQTKWIEILAEKSEKLLESNRFSHMVEVIENIKDMTLEFQDDGGTVNFGIMPTAINHPTYANFDQNIDDIKIKMASIGKEVIYVKLSIENIEKINGKLSEKSIETLIDTIYTIYNYILKEDLIVANLFTKEVVTRNRSDYGKSEFFHFDKIENLANQIDWIKNDKLKDLVQKVDRLKFKDDILFRYLIDVRIGFCGNL